MPCISISPTLKAGVAEMKMSRAAMATAMNPEARRQPGCMTGMEGKRISAPEAPTA